MATQKKTLSAGQKVLQETKGYNSLYRQYISQGKTPTEAEALANMTYGAKNSPTKPLPITTKSGATTTGVPAVPVTPMQEVVNEGGFSSGSASDMGELFNQQWQDLINASQQAYGIDTGRQLEQFQQRRQDTELQRQRNAEDYAKYTGREQQDFNRSIAMRDKDFAAKLSQAANAYGQRGLLKGGLFKKASGEAVGDYADDNVYLKTLSQRKMEDLGQAQLRGEQDITKSLERLQTSENQYRTDRDAGSKILGIELQTKGDEIYNQAQSNLYALEQEKARQDALDRQYGIKTVPRTPVFRFGGKYTK